jgi:ribose transport system ATP-binding protein
MSGVVVSESSDRLGHPQAVVRLQDVCKTFGSTKALDNVSMTIDRGEIRCLIGGNGSGKSTLVKILAGVYRADEGAGLEINGRQIRAGEMTPEIARDAGLRFVHQNPGLFLEMTVAENVALGSSFPGRRPGINWRALRRRTADLLERFGINAAPDDRVADLRPADRTMVAVARSLQDWESNEISALVLDEATASLPEHEVQVLLEAVRRCAQLGQTVIFVSHRLDEVLAIADSVSVLRDGKHAVTRQRADVDRARLIEDIVGRPLQSTHGRSAAAQTQSTGHLLEVRGITGGPLHDVSLQVDGGEIVGIAGLLGSGRTELLRTIFGAYPAKGEILVGSDRVTISSPAEAMKLGVAYVPEDREVDAAFLAMSVRENITIGDLGRYWSRGRFLRHAEERDIKTHVDTFGIVASSIEQLLATLSGGNQQKVILSRWMNRDPKILLLDEPTQGVDVGARADVHAAIRQFAERGMGVLMVSSDFEELVQSTDRILVLHDGHITADVATLGLESQTVSELVFSGRGYV